MPTIKPIPNSVTIDPMHTNVSLGDFTVTPKMRKYVNDVLDSGRISYGPLCRRFEEIFAGIHACSYAVLSNSGTSSLQVAIQTLKELHGWRNGSEILIPSLTFVATANACLHNQLIPIPVDIDPDFYGMAPYFIEKAITRNTVAILPVNPFGQPAALDLISQIAQRRNLKVIEDSCESMFASCGSTSVGAWGDIACFSTYAAHLVNTGVGGISTTSNPDYAKYMRSLVNHGIDLTELPTGTAYDPTFLSRKFRFTSIGHSFRITELEAALGLAQLEDFPAMIQARQENADYLTSLLSVADELIRLPRVRGNCTHSWMMYPIVLTYMQKYDMMNHLMVRGIETREMLPLTNQPCYVGLFDPTAYPVANHINHHGFYVGCHQSLTRTQLDYMAQEILTFLYDGESNAQKESSSS